MILIDTGPLVAVLNRHEPSHQTCAEAFRKLPLPLLTTWPVFTEAMHLLRRLAGWTGQQALWELVTRDAVAIVDASPDSRHRMQELMAKYRDVPMALADASLIALAEERGTTRIFTLDSDFEVYRLANKKRLSLLP